MMARRTLLFTVFLAIGLAFAPVGAKAADAAAASRTVKAAVDEGLATFVGKSYPLDERTRLLDNLLRRYLDPGLLSASMLGRYWPRITPAEQEAFSDLFMRYLVSSYVGQLRNLQDGLKLTVGTGEDLGAKARVTSIATLPSQPGQPIPVEWEVVPTPEGRMVIMDFTAQGISLIRAMRDDFASVLRSSGGKVEPLMEALRRKIDANDKANAVTG